MATSKATTIIQGAAPRFRHRALHNPGHKRARIVGREGDEQEGDRRKTREGQEGAQEGGKGERRGGQEREKRGTRGGREGDRRKTEHSGVGASRDRLDD